jgi:hypothetical protein
MLASCENRNSLVITFLAFGLGLAQKEPAIVCGIEIKELFEEISENTASEIIVLLDSNAWITFGCVADSKNRSAGFLPYPVEPRYDHGHIIVLERIGQKPGDVVDNDKAGFVFNDVGFYLTQELQTECYLVFGIRVMVIKIFPYQRNVTFQQHAMPLKEVPVAELKIDNGDFHRLTVVFKGFTGRKTGTRSGRESELKYKQRFSVIGPRKEKCRGVFVKKSTSDLTLRGGI